ncbi:MAG: histidinol-phosphatase [Hyphomicrobium sp.]
MLRFAHDLANRSGAVIRPHFREPMTIENKASGAFFDPVTAADRAAEQAIAAQIRASLPGHGIVGEEFGSHNPDARHRWVVDPIDGTRAFVMGSPLWGTLIGLLDNGEPVLGLMDQPFTRERFWSDAASSHLRTGDGRERRLATRPCTGLADAVLTSTDPDLFPPGPDAEAFTRVRRAVRMTRFGGDCYAYCLLAAGFIDLVVECGLKPFDIVALIPIIERAGGRVTTWDGRPATAGGRIVAAGDARVHEQAMALLAG